METVINDKIGGLLLKPEYTRDIIAKKLNMTRPTLSTRLNGKSEWTWKEVKAIANLTDTSLDELAGISK